MHDLPDHPIIRNLERTGYPDGKEPRYPHCPVCGEECEIIYRRYSDDECVGCDGCLLRFKCLSGDLEHMVPFYKSNFPPVMGHHAVTILDEMGVWCR